MIEHALFEPSLLAAALFGAIAGWWCAGFAERYSRLLETIGLYDAGGACLLVQAVSTGQRPASDSSGSSVPSVSSDSLHSLDSLDSDAGKSDTVVLRWGLAALLATVAVALYSRYGCTLIFFATVAGIGALLVLAVVDAKTSLLPDALTLPLLWLGLAMALMGREITLEASVAGAMAGYCFLYALFWMFKLFRKQDGMGYGDFKLLAALGAWVGFASLPYLLLMACLGGVAFAFMRQKNLTLTASYPFGPFLVASGIGFMALAPEVQSYFW